MIKAVELVGGIGRFVKAGAIVVVKANIPWNVPPQLKATTDPLVVRMVVHLCFQAQAAREAGATVLEVDEVSAKLYQPTAIPGGVYLKESLINKRVPAVGQSPGVDRVPGPGRAEGNRGS